RDVVLGVPNALAPRKLLDVAAPEPLRLERREALAREQHGDVARDATVAVRVERYGPRDRVRDPLRREHLAELLERGSNVGGPHEEAIRRPRGRPKESFSIRAERRRHDHEPSTPRSSSLPGSKTKGSARVPEASGTAAKLRGWAMIQNPREKQRSS